ncbi:MAG: hypothetical protein FJZ61_01545 [Chlamydiae bacterium]|nr:hypothetical protein [Chlamydiota bacterium]
MGGIGSGTGIRPNRKRTKQFVEAFPQIDSSDFPFSSMRLLPKKACQLSTRGVNFQIYPDRLLIFQETSPAVLLYEIFFSLTPAHYGNQRYWFKCPKCNHRRRKLLLVHIDDGFPLFLCRCCLNLVYQSQNRTQGDQIIHKKWTLIQKLGWNSECIPNKAKPKGMHWKTFNIFREQVDWLHEKAFQFAPNFL